MLTPMQLKDKSFQAAGRNAYRSEDVDVFMREVFASYDQMFRENGELLRRVSLLAERLEQYREDEDSIKSAVITAQRAADRIVKEATERADLLTKEATDILTAAKSEAETIRRDTENSVRTELHDSLENAKKEAETIILQATNNAKDIVMTAEAEAKNALGAANRAVTSESILFDMLKKEVSEFKSDIMTKYKTHIELISQLPEIAGDKANDKAPDVPVAQVSFAVPETPVTEEAPDQTTSEEVPDQTASEDAGCEECAEPSIDTTSPAEIEYINSKDDDVILPFEEFTPPPVQRSVPEQPFSVSEAPARQPELVLDTPIPFATDEGSDELEFIKEDELSDGVLNVDDFIQNFEEKPVNTAPPKKRGFNLDKSKLTAQEPAPGQDAAAADTEPDGVGAGLFGSPEDTQVPVFDSRHSADRKKESEPAASEQDNDDDETPGRLFGGRRDDLKKRFSVISMADNSHEDDDDIDDDDDDDDDSPPPTFKSLFKKKK